SVLLYLPQRFHSSGNESMYVLLKDSGYFENHANVTVSEIHKGLIDHPRYKDHWIAWAENKRVDTGWYIKKVSNDKFIVGYLANMQETGEIEHSDESLAVAS